MKAIGYDAMALGNHEFDNFLGRAEKAKRTGGLSIPLGQYLPSPNVCLNRTKF